MSTRSDFDVMAEMSKNNMDIRMSGNIVQINKVKKGGHIVMSVDEKTMYDLMSSALCPEATHIAVLYVLNQKQFFDLKEAPSSIKEDEKAKKWDALERKIAACYINPDGTENENSDLGTIGEIAAGAFGYL